MFYKPHYGSDFVSFYKVGPRGSKKKKATWISEDKKSREISFCFAAPLGMVKDVNFNLNKKHLDKEDLESFYTSFQRYFFRYREGLRSLITKHKFLENDPFKAFVDFDHKKLDFISAALEAFDDALFLIEKFFNTVFNPDFDELEGDELKEAIDKLPHYKRSPEYKRAFMRLIHGGLELAIDRHSYCLQYENGKGKSLGCLRKAQRAKKLVDDWLFLEKEADREKVEEFFEYPKIKSFPIKNRTL